jgi:hypothetical protein
MSKIPWKLIFGSFPVWSICCAHFARGWTFYLLLTNQPSFLNAFGFGVTENGTLGSLPHILTVLVALSSGFIADYMRLNLLWSTTNVRKIMTCSGMKLNFLRNKLFISSSFYLVRIYNRSNVSFDNVLCNKSIYRNRIT